MGANSRSIMAKPEHKILMMQFNSALKTRYIEKSGFYIRGTKTLSFCPSSQSVLRIISNFSAKQMPFKVNFTSDGFESQQEAMTPPSPNQNDKGFKLSYYQVGC